MENQAYYTSADNAVPEHVSVNMNYLYFEEMHEDEMVIIGDPGPENLFDWAVYDRGALTLHALRLTVGDDAFFQILRAYADRYHDGNASTADFIALAEEISGQQLDDLFQAWLYDRALPPMPE